VHLCTCLLLGGEGLVGQLKGVSGLTGGVCVETEWFSLCSKSIVCINVCEREKCVKEKKDRIVVGVLCVCVCVYHACECVCLSV
jgi:hypothetical protein